MSKKSNSHVYDYVIIGSGLSGLTIATAISKETENVLLLEAGDSFGGLNKAIKNPAGILNNGLRFVPDTLTARKSLNFLESLIGGPLIKDSIERPPITYEASGFKQFLGFGENPPAFYDELSYFTFPMSLELSIEPYAWIQLLFESFKGEFLPRSYVTKFIADEDSITQVMVNGSRTVSGKNFIFCGNIKDLSILLPESALPNRARQKLAKTTYWTGVSIDFCHSKAISDSQAIHILNGTTQDDIGPCAGRFYSSQQSEEGQVVQASQWMTFVDQEASEDSEIVAHALKKIKRQIKRAYPDAFEGIIKERIMVAPNFAGHPELKLNANQSLANAANLWIGSTQINKQRNLVGSLSQAELILSALGFNTVNNIDQSVTIKENTQVEEAVSED